MYRGSAYITGNTTGVFIVSGLASIFIINLFKFSSGMASALVNQDVAAYEKGIFGLKNYYIFMGIVILILIFHYVVRLMS